MDPTDSNDPSPLQNMCSESGTAPNGNRHSIQIATKTAQGVPGKDQMNPLNPGHAVVVHGIEDQDRQMSRVETYGLQPRGGVFDNFIAQDTANDPKDYPFGPGNDVRVNHKDDFPTPSSFPFVSNPAEISREQYEYSRWLASQSPDYQVGGNNCVDFAVQNYNATVGQEEFTASSEYGISSPRLLGRDILDHNAAAAAAKAGIQPQQESASFGAGVVAGMGGVASAGFGAGVAAAVGGKFGPVVGQAAEGVANHVLGKLIEGGLSLDGITGSGGPLSTGAMMDLASKGLNAIAGGGIAGGAAEALPGLAENIVAGGDIMGSLGGMLDKATGQLIDQAFGQLCAVTDETPAGEAIAKTMAKKYKDQLMDLASDPSGTLGKLKALFVPGPVPTSAASVPLGLATPAGAGLVLVGGAMACARIGDMCSPIPSVPPDAGPFIQGNPTVIINGKPAAGFGHLAIGLSKGTPGTALVPAPTVLMGAATVTDLGIYCAAKEAAAAVPNGGGGGSGGGGGGGDTNASSNQTDPVPAPAAEGEGSPEPGHAQSPPDDLESAPPGNPTQPEMQPDFLTNNPTEPSDDDAKRKILMEQIGADLDSGRDDYAYDKAKGPLGSGTNKCTLYVKDRLEENGYDLPERSCGRFRDYIDGAGQKCAPLAAELADKTYGIPTLPVVQSGDPRPGDVIAYAQKYADASGHAGFVEAFDPSTGKGTYISQSAITNKISRAEIVRESDGTIRMVESGSGKRSNPTTVRRPTTPESPQP